MALSSIYSDDGRIVLDDVTRIATIYNTLGVQTGTRPFTPEENSLANAAALRATEAANRNTIELALADALIEVQATIDATNQQINSNPAAHIKVQARAIRRIIRLLIRRFDGTT